MISLNNLFAILCQKSCWKVNTMVQLLNYESSSVGSSLISSRNVVSFSILMPVFKVEHSFPLEHWFICAFNWPLCLNALSHVEQANGFSPVWVLSCFFKSHLCINALRHLVQAYGFSPVWILLCVFNSLLVLNALSHLEQANGFSPV